LLHILLGWHPVPSLADRSGPAASGEGDYANRTLWIGFLAAVLLCSCALQDDVYTLDHRLSTLERRNMELEKQNRELQKVNQDMLQTKENIYSRVDGLDQTRREDELALRGQYAGLAAQLQSQQESSQLLSGRLEEMEYLLNQKLNRFEENQVKNNERMDRLATDMAAAQKRLAMIDQYLNLESAKVSKPNVPVASSAAAAKPASDQDLYLEAKKAFDAGSLETARNGFKKLIADYPSLPRRTIPSSGSVRPIIGKSGMKKPSWNTRK
jgi:chromosome segregation ATPase